MGNLTKLCIGFILGRSFTLPAFALFADTLRLASDEFDRSGRVSADWQVLASSRNPVRSSLRGAGRSDFGARRSSQFQLHRRGWRVAQGGEAC